VANALTDPSVTILDVRTGGEYRGEQFWPSGGMEPGGRAGHAPSAMNLPIEALHDDDGAFRRAEDIRRLFAPVDTTGGRDVIPCCTIGARACTTWFALTYLLGHQHVRVYDGSWAEWGRMQGVPVESP
jgi:thiosulfate/3-mercaptopyruvate sulfurtransferase